MDALRRDEDAIPVREKCRGISVCWEGTSALGTAAGFAFECQNRRRAVREKKEKKKNKMRGETER